MSTKAQCVLEEIRRPPPVEQNEILKELQKPANSDPEARERARE